jgi:hypothetical protein
MIKIQSRNETKKKQTRIKSSDSQRKEQRYEKLKAKTGKFNNDCTVIPLQSPITYFFLQILRNRTSKLPIGFDSKVTELSLEN